MCVCVCVRVEARSKPNVILVHVYRARIVALRAVERVRPRGSLHALQLVLLEEDDPEIKDAPTKTLVIIRRVTSVVVLCHHATAQSDAQLCVLGAEEEVFVLADFEPRVPGHAAQ